MTTSAPSLLRNLHDNVIKGIVTPKGAAERLRLHHWIWDYPSDNEILQILKIDMRPIRVGDTIKIIHMVGEPHYDGRTGIVTFIDDENQAHGTWGGLALQPERDAFHFVENTSRSAEQEKKRMDEFKLAYSRAAASDDYSKLNKRFSFFEIVRYKMMLKLQLTGSEFEYFTDHKKDFENI